MRRERMTDDEKREFNLKCAGIMGYEWTSTVTLLINGKHIHINDYSPADPEKMNQLAEVFDKVWKRRVGGVYAVAHAYGQGLGSAIQSKGIKQAMIDFIREHGESE
jgi:hypothetical protein